MGHGGKEQIKLTENRFETWTCVYMVKNLQ